MKYYIFSHGDSSVGIEGCSARVEIDEIENWKIDDIDCLKIATEELERAFSEIFGEKAYVLPDTQGGKLSNRPGTHHGNKINSIKIVWGGFHHDLEVVAPACRVGGVMVVHVSSESMKGIIGDNVND